MIANYKNLISVLCKLDWSVALGRPRFDLIWFDFQVKGRRFCQCRLVEPEAASINSGDCYILVTGKEVFNWQGKFSNVIERSRSAEVALTIIQKKVIIVNIYHYNHFVNHCYSFHHCYWYYYHHHHYQTLKAKKIEL